MLDRQKIIKENQAYDELIKGGYRPQGLSGGKCCVMHIENENGNNEKRQVWAFDSWQEASEKLLKA